MIYVQIFLAFFIPGIVGYGGGPASIPLVQYEVVDRYEWMTVEEFSEVLALGKCLAWTNRDKNGRLHWI